MSWPSYDRTTGGLILSIVALIGAFPLSLLANLATPAIRNWWAERSVSSLKRRIIALERELAEIEKTPVISDGEERILRALTWMGIVLTQLLGFFILTIGTILVYKIKGKVDDRYVNAGIGVLATVIIGAQGSIMMPTLDFLRKRSRTQRERMRKEIEILETSFAGRGQRLMVLT